MASVSVLGPSHILHSAIKRLRSACLIRISVFPDTLKVSPVALPSNWALSDVRRTERKSSSPRELYAPGVRSMLCPIALSGLWAVGGCAGGWEGYGLLLDACRNERQGCIGARMHFEGERGLKVLRGQQV